MSPLPTTQPWTCQWKDLAMFNSTGIPALLCLPPSSVTHTRRQHALVAHTTHADAQTSNLRGPFSKAPLLHKFIIDFDDHAVAHEVCKRFAIVLLRVIRLCSDCCKRIHQLDWSKRIGSGGLVQLDESKRIVRYRFFWHRRNTVVQCTGLSPPPHCAPFNGTSTGPFLRVINLQFARCDAIVFAALLLLLKVNAKKVAECTKMMQIHDAAILICVRNDFSFTVKNRQRSDLTVVFFKFLLHH